MATHRIYRERCEDLSHPLGLDNPHPRFSWVYEGDNPSSAQAEIRVAVRESEEANAPILWDSGWQVCAATAMAYDGPALASCHRYGWKAYTRLIDSPQTTVAESAECWFETGILPPDAWHAQWIRADPAEEAPILLRHFTLKTHPARARAYICGLGFFVLWVNGRRVGAEVLQPVNTAYSRQKLRNMLYPYDYQGAYRVPYRVFDLGPYLREGDNRIEVHLGNGWYHQNQRLVEGDLWYGETPVLLFEARMDGITLVSDDRWQWRESQTVRNNLFYGETVDRTREPGAPRPVETAPAPMGALRAQTCPSDAVLQEYPVVRAFPARDGQCILDFGQNLSGWIALCARARRGDRLELRFAEEICADGEEWRLQYDSAGGEKQIQMDAFILDGGGEESLCPQFCWHGFRYAQVALLRANEPVALCFKDGALKADGFQASATAQLVAANLATSGAFSCGCDLLNWYHRASVISMRCNQHCGVPLDCPHRERLGYTGDGQVTMPAMLLNLDANAFAAKWMRDIFDAQNRQTGHVPHTAPFYNGGGGPGGWGGAVVFVPWALYRHTGNASILREAWPHILPWLEYLRNHSEGGLVVREEDGGWCLGDWCTPEPIAMDPALVNTAFAIQMLEISAQIAVILGEARAAGALRAEARERRGAFYRAFGQGSALLTQGGMAFALWAKAMPEAEYASALKRLLDHMQSRGWHFDTGIFATPILLDVLSENGYADAAFRLMTAQGYPSFAQMRSRGATTLYEHWNGGGSHNHAMFGAADAWLFAWATGLRQETGSAGWQRIVLQPGAIASLHSAQASIDTPLGRCSLRWQREANALHVSAAIPTLAQAALLLPDGSRQALPPGIHEACYPLS